MAISSVRWSLLCLPPRPLCSPLRPLRFTKVFSLSPTTASKAAAEYAENYRNSRNSMKAVSAALRQFRVLRGCLCCLDEYTLHGALPLTLQPERKNVSLALMSGE
jgi:hypothetical protein